MKLSLDDEKKESRKLGRDLMEHGKGYTKETSRSKKEDKNMVEQ